jgi:hypothetical protein
MSRPVPGQAGQMPKACPVCPALPTLAFKKDLFEDGLNH